MFQNWTPLYWLIITHSVVCCTTSHFLSQNQFSNGTIYRFLFQFPVSSFPNGHAIAAYVFLLIFSHSYPPSISPSVTWFSRQDVADPVSLLLFTMCRIFRSSLAGFDTDVWLTVHRNSVWIRNQLDVTFVLSLFLFYKLLNMFRATMCPSSGADDCVMLSPRVGIVPWLQEGCQVRLAVDVTFCILYFSFTSCSTCFGQPCAHLQELTTA